MSRRNSNSKIKEFEFISFHSKLSTSQNNIYQRYIQHRSNFSLIPVNPNHDFHSVRNSSSSHAFLMNNHKLKEFRGYLLKKDKVLNFNKFKNTEVKQANFISKKANNLKGYKKQNNSPNNVKNPTNKVSGFSDIKALNNFSQTTNCLSKYLKSSDKNLTNKLCKNLNVNESTNMKINIESIVTQKNIKIQSLLQSTKYKEFKPTSTKIKSTKISKAKNENSNKNKDANKKIVNQYLNKGNGTTNSKAARSIYNNSNYFNIIDYKIPLNALKMKIDDKEIASSNKKNDNNISISSMFDLDENIENIKLYKIDHYVYQPIGEKEESIEI